MQLYKKRARILAEKLGGELSYGHTGSLAIRLGKKTATFDPVSVSEMDCMVQIGAYPACHRLP